MTLQSHILANRIPTRTPGAPSPGSCRRCRSPRRSSRTRSARTLENVLGSVGAENVQGEVQQKLDVLANDVLMKTLGGVKGAIVASEENEERSFCAATPAGAALLRAVRSARRLLKPRHLRRVGTIFSILAYDGRRRARRTRCSSQGPDRSRRGMSCTARRPFSCSPSAGAWTCSSSIRPSAPSCAWSAT